MAASLDPCVVSAHARHVGPSPFSSPHVLKSDGAWELDVANELVLVKAQGPRDGDRFDSPAGS